MTARGPSVELREVAPGEREAFFAMLADYLAELDAYELPWDPAPPVEAYREAIDADPDGQQIEWVVADGERSGFLITRVVPDWPEEAREVGEVIESYVERRAAWPRRRARRRRDLARADAGTRHRLGGGFGAVGEYSGAALLGAARLRDARGADDTQAVSRP